MSGLTLPYASLSVNSCAWYMFSTKRSHVLELQRLACYLKQTKYCGFVLNPNYYLCKLDLYPDAYFAGVCGHENTTNPACVKSRTGFIITFADFTVLLISKLQTDTAISTMEV